MRQVLILLLAALPVVQSCLPKLEDLGGYSGARKHYTETVTLDPGYDTRTLYLNAKRWFAFTFPDTEAVIQMDEPEEIIGRGITYIEVPTGVEDNKTWVALRFIVSVRFREGRYRYDVSSLTLGEHRTPMELASDDTRMPNKRSKQARQAQAYRAGVDAAMQEIVGSLKTMMEAGGGSSADKW